MDSIKFWTEGVLTIPGADSLRAAAKMMHVKDVSSLLIVEGKKPVGIVTERDVVVAAAKDLDFDKTKVVEVMSRNLVTVNINDSLTTAQNLMLEHKCSHILVVDGNGEIAGVASLSDLTRIWKNRNSVRVLKFR
jgi:CBS domain-containing protein